MIDEKAREAIRLTLEWDERRGYLLPYAVRDKLRLAYESAKQKGEAEGWVLVPKEPSSAQLDRAVAFALNVSLGGDYRWTDYMRDLYGRFLSAAGER